MPRIPTSTIIKAYRQNRLLPILLQECRSLSSAQNELRWLWERAIEIGNANHARNQCPRKYPAPGWKRLLNLMCRARSKGMPLQYILGDQPFGHLEILCQKGILIPRPETESYTIHAAELISRYFLATGQNGSVNSSGLIRPVRIIDLCTAIQLATRNLSHNLQLGLLSDRSCTEVHFHQGDVLGHDNGHIPRIEEILETHTLQCTKGSGARESFDWDVMISNPPYISPNSLRDGTTARSVRLFEPQLALVPPANVNHPTTMDYRREDIFYHHLIALSFKLSIRLTILECGSHQQGSRVAAICKAFSKKLPRDNEWTVDIWSEGQIDHRDNTEGPCIVILRK
ncbi:uncharacterized protein ACHE_50278A [Aspergillus chevalieri]|uniref:Uncharacterized protein n=1 Tax=Aspergillus chevalieri TaxID=182096 RepID=A0A7R7VQQ1_ASPCH|nr:uncharacterized protein ACHE_50278A [Aspergillus chevalieri]BCR89080.1 hypothetical protein ACHE_50278A [Aspergillus chevalieri]